jgi:periplasmic protein CpxP/Spy
MKTSRVMQLGLAIAGVLLAGTMMAQQPGGGMGQGMGPEHGFGEHRPPMEKAMGPCGGHGRWWNNPKVVERLKLTDAQKKEFDSTLLEHRKKLIDLHANLERVELEMDPLMRADQPDEGKILSQIDKVAQARAELEKANARFLLAIRSKLTPEQWKQMEADRASHWMERQCGDMGKKEPGPAGRRHHGHHRPAPPAQGPQGNAGPGAGPAE